MSVITAAKFRSELDRWGVRYVEHSRYDRCLKRDMPWHEHEARRYRDCARRGWDAHGIAIHHSGGPTAWWYVWDGRLLDNIPGPLYTALIYEDGVAHLTGWRVTNNVGRCDKTVRDRVLAGNMPTTSGNVDPGADDYAAANSEFYGISYRGTTPNTAQRRTARLISAAICTGHGGGWDGGSIAGHKELTQRKPDPEGEDMGLFRRDVNQLLDVGPARLVSNTVTIGGITYGSGTGWEIDPSEEDDMPLNAEDMQKIAAVLRQHDGNPVGEYNGRPLSRDEAMFRGAQFAGGGLNELKYRVTPALAALRAEHAEDPAAVAAELAPLVIPPVVAAVGELAQLTPEQVEEAAEKAIRDVLGSLDQ